jgi:hypothetical protein
VLPLKAVHYGDVIEGSWHKYIQRWLQRFPSQEKPSELQENMPVRRSENRQFNLYLLPRGCLNLDFAYGGRPTPKSSLRRLLEAIFPFPIAYCLLPIAYCLLPIAYCLLPIAYWNFNVLLLPLPVFQQEGTACALGLWVYQDNRWSVLCSHRHCWRSIYYIWHSPAASSSCFCVCFCSHIHVLLHPLVVPVCACHGGWSVSQKRAIMPGGEKKQINNQLSQCTQVSHFSLFFLLANL